MVTEIQRETIKAIGSDNEYFNPNLTNSAATKLGITQGALSSRVGEVFEDFKELANIMAENYPIFERRFKAHPDLYTPLRSIARRMKGR